VEYPDGLRGTVLLLNGHVQDCCFAARLQGQPRPVSCLFQVPPLPGARAFDCLASRVEHFIESRSAPWPIQRSLLTTAVLNAAMESHYRRGNRLETPELDICYG
jgi:hypothetical protein